MPDIKKLDLQDVGPLVTPAALFLTTAPVAGVTDAVDGQLVRVSAVSGVGPFTDYTTRRTGEVGTTVFQKEISADVAATALSKKVEKMPSEWAGFVTGGTYIYAGGPATIVCSGADRGSITVQNDGTFPIVFQGYSSADYLVPEGRTVRFNATAAGGFTTIFTSPAYATAEQGAKAELSAQPLPATWTDIVSNGKYVKYNTTPITLTIDSVVSSVSIHNGSTGNITLSFANGSGSQPVLPGQTVFLTTEGDTENPSYFNILSFNLTPDPASALSLIQSTTATNTTGDTTIIVPNGMPDLHSLSYFRGVARTSNVILSNTNALNACEVRIVCLFPTTSGIITNFRNLTAGGTLLDTITTDTTGDDATVLLGYTTVWNKILTLYPN